MIKNRRRRFLWPWLRQSRCLSIALAFAVKPQYQSEAEAESSYPADDGVGDGGRGYR